MHTIARHLGLSITKTCIYNHFYFVQICPVHKRNENVSLNGDLSLGTEFGNIRFSYI